MTTWQHTETVTLPGGPSCRGCFADARHCTTPTPDPASPCGHVFPDDIGCGYPEGDVLHRPEPPILGHPHVPTRCTCGHPLEATR